MAVTKAMLVSELQEILRLTAFEQTIATVRRAQAASSPVADELKANAAKSVERAQLLAGAVRDLGGVPDVVGATLSKAGAFLQTQVNQVQTLQGALLGDLALEHQLRDRTRYARTLAVSLGLTQVLPVLDRLETAHTATIAWLETRLDEVGRTGTSALRTTPVQKAVGSVVAVASAPFGLLAGGVNRASSLLRRGATTVEQTAEQVAGEVREQAEALPAKARQAAETARATATSVLDRAEADVEQVADDAATEQVLDLTGLDPQHEPFAAFHTLSGDSVMRHVAQLEDVQELRETLAFETAHKNRKGVVQALEARLTELATASA